MVQRKRSTEPPQPQHRSKPQPSRHDKRMRLSRANDLRRSTQAAAVPLVGTLAVLATAMGRLLDARTASRLPIVLAGAMLAGGRRTAASWFRAAGVADDWDRFYELLQSFGRKAASLAQPIAQTLIGRFDPGPGGFWQLVIDDSPTRRFGPRVEAANIHRNPTPTPGPGDGPWLYGHNWVCLAVLPRHPLFGAIALPLLSSLYVRAVDVPRLPQAYRWSFRTKHELALELLLRVMSLLWTLGSPAGFRVVFNGAYAAGELVRPLLERGAVVLTRLRRDAQLFDLPAARPSTARTASA